MKQNDPMASRPEREHYAAMMAGGSRNGELMVKYFKVLCCFREPLPSVADCSERIGRGRQLFSSGAIMCQANRPLSPLHVAGLAMQNRVGATTCIVLEVQNNGLAQRAPEARGWSS